MNKEKKIESLAKYYKWDVETLKEILLFNDMFNGKDLLDKLCNSVIVYRKR